MLPNQSGLTGISTIIQSTKSDVSASLTDGLESRLVRRSRPRRTVWKNEVWSKNGSIFTRVRLFPPCIQLEQRQEGGVQGAENIFDQEGPAELTAGLFHFK